MVQILNMALFSKFCMGVWDATGISVAYSAPERHGCLRVVENDWCASKRGLYWKFIVLEIEVLLLSKPAKKSIAIVTAEDRAQWFNMGVKNFIVDAVQVVCGAWQL